MAHSLAIPLFLALALALHAPSVYGEETIPTAIHVHSEISSGGKSILEIASLAKEQHVGAVIFTDLYHEKYEYGFSFFKKTVERNSIMRTGPAHYLQQIQEAADAHPEILLIDGTAVTPFYFWSGNLWPGPLVLNNRAKDLLVLGLGEPLKYAFLPVVQNGRSSFDPYQGDPFSKPYQKFIEEASKLGGLVFWSHPQASERVRFENVFLGLDVLLYTPPYAESLLETSGYTGFGVFSSELAQIHTASETTLSPGGVWDRVLRQHCRDQRPPVWAIGEVDYSGTEKGIQALNEILNMVTVPEKSRRALLKSLAEGKVYLVIPASAQRQLLLENYAVLDRTSGRKAGSGETLHVEGVPVVRLQAKLSDQSSGTLQILLLRNGSIIERWSKTLPFTLDYEDWKNTDPGKSYYRIVAYAEDTPDRLMTNPIFVERPA